MQKKKKKKEKGKNELKRRGRLRETIAFPLCRLVPGTCITVRLRRTLAVICRNIKWDQQINAWEEGERGAATDVGLLGLRHVVGPRAVGRPQTNRLARELLGEVVVAQREWTRASRGVCRGQSSEVKAVHGPIGITLLLSLTLALSRSLSLYLSFSLFV